MATRISITAFLWTVDAKGDWTPYAMIALDRPYPEWRVALTTPTHHLWREPPIPIPPYPTFWERVFRCVGNPSGPYTYDYVAEW